MQRLPIIVIALTLPVMFFVVLTALSSGLFNTTTIRPAPTAPAAEEVAEAPAAEDTAEETVAEAAAEDVAEDAAPAADTAAAEAPTATEDTAATEDAATPEEAVAEAPAEALAEAPVEEPAGDTAGTELATAEAAETPEVTEVSAVADTVDLAAIAAGGDARAGARLWRQCSACHVADQAQNRVGPHLVGVLGRSVNSVEGFRYSGALAEHGAEIWTAEKMSAWLENPRDYAPGTSMSYRGIADAEDRANLLAYLADLQLQSGS